MKKVFTLFAVLFLFMAELQAQPITSFPWTEGYESNGTIPIGWTQQQIDNTIDWTFPESGTGTPFSVHSGAYKARFYSSIKGSVAKLISPELNISGLSNPMLTFWHTQKNWDNDQDTLRIYYRVSSSGQWILLQTYSSNISDWKEEKILLPNKANDYYLAFEGKAEYGYGIQLDDISIGNALDNDGGIEAILSPVVGSVSAAQVKITLKNYGSNPITNMVVKYQLNNQNPVSQNYTGNLESLSTEIFIFATSVNVSAYESYTLKVWTELPGDENPVNDTATVIFSFNRPSSDYNAADKAALRNFLRQPSANGTWNGANLGLSPIDTISWQTHEDWIPSVAGILWNDNNPANITSISWNSTNLAGNLNVSGCDSLTELHCYNNQLTTLDLSTNTSLTFLECSYNPLTVLDLSRNTALTALYCRSNQLTALDLSKNTALTTLYCSSNELTDLDLNKNTALTILYCYSNQLTALNLSTNTILTHLFCYSNELTDLDLSKNTSLIWLYCYLNQLTSLNLSENTSLTKLYCNSNQLMSLDLSQNTALTELFCNSNRLTSLDLSKNTALISLNCSSNQLTDLDMSKNTVLAGLDCSYNQLTNLDLSKNIALTGFLECSYNHLTDLDLSENTVLTGVNCSSNQLKNLNLSESTVLANLYCVENHLPLAVLNTLSQRADITYKELGIQTMPLANVALDTSIAVDTVFHGNGTFFMVFKYDGTPAVENIDYSVSGGNITFLLTGIYKVETSNTAIVSDNIAKVVSFYLANIGLPIAKTVPFIEDFESGTADWYFANGTQTNQWLIGAAVAKTGAYAMYISDNGTENHYNTSSTSIVHFFCDVAFTLSATGYQLSFDWKGVGEMNWDDLKIFLIDTTELPFAGYNLESTLGTYGNDSTWQQAITNIPASYSGTVKRLVFSWRNDGTGGENPPIAIDNISIKNLDMPATGISLNKHEISLVVNTSETLTAIVNPSNATNKNVSWTNHNKSIATINADGLVTGISEGITYIVATTQDGGFMDSCKVIVTPVTGIEKSFAEENKFVVYPNPTFNGQLTIETSPQIPKGGFKDGIQLYDLAGKLVDTFAITGEKTEINISDLPGGTYFVKVGNTVKKVTKR